MKNLCFILFSTVFTDLLVSTVSSSSSSLSWKVYSTGGLIFFYCFGSVGSGNLAPTIASAFLMELAVTSTVSYSSFKSAAFVFLCMCSNCCSGVKSSNLATPVLPPEPWIGSDDDADWTKVTPGKCFWLSASYESLILNTFSKVSPL